MQNKFKIFAASLLAAATLGMASCDVDASLTKGQGETPILNLAEGETILSNKLQAIYDEIVVSGTSNSERILNKILLTTAESTYGPFYTPAGSTEKGLFETVTSGSDADILAYANKYKDSNAFDADTDAGKIAKVRDFYETVATSFKKTFWNAVTNSTYQKRSIFNEELFYKAQKAELYKLPEFNGIWGEGLIDGALNYENVADFFHGGSVVEMFTFYRDYIERALIPTVYRKALVEKYLFDNNWNTLGRTYARKVQYVAIPQIEGYEGYAEKLIRSYAMNVLAAEDNAIITKATTAGMSFNSDADKTAFVAEVRNLHYLDKLYSGYFEASDWNFANTIYRDAGFGDDDLVYLDNDPLSNVSYKQTAYGKLLDDWNRVTDNRFETGSTTDFTGSGAYSSRTGLEIRTRNIIGENKTTEGWYTSSGLSDLPSSIRGRLFRNSVANEVDLDQGDAYTTKVQGSYYMIPEKYSADEKYPYIQYDSSSSTYYIVRVDEAVRFSKMAKDSEDCYDKIHGEGQLTLNQIAWKVCDLIADGDSYKKAANQYYVQKAAISFHDDTVYKYFEDTFPDLFD